MRVYSFHFVGVLCVAAIVVGCSSTPSVSTPQTAAPSADPVRITSRPGNVQGSILILEYHRVRKEEARWDRSTKGFRADLERLYAMGFRPVTVRDVLDGMKELPPGASPVVLTFDDSDPSQLRYLEDGTLDPECAVGIWQAFAAEHPDFPVRGSFYLLPPSPWGQPQWTGAKLKWLIAQGSEIGSHTVTHRSLKSLSDAEVAAELGGAQQFLTDAGGGRIDTIALPLGVSPKNPDLLRECQWEGKTYTHRAVLLVGAGPAPSPQDPKFNPFRLPRIQAIEGDYGITYWLDKVAQGEVDVYVKD